MCKVSDKSEMVGEIIGWFDMELPHMDIPIWISIWESPQRKIIFLFSTQFHGFGDAYWDIRMDIHTDIPILMELC